MSAQTLIVYAPVLVALCVVAAVGVSWRTVDEPPIYDRQTDVIVGIVVMVLAVAVKSLVNPRYERAYLTIHMDLLALWLYVFGAAVLLFGCVRRSGTGRCGCCSCSCVRCRCGRW